MYFLNFNPNLLDNSCSFLNENSVSIALLNTSWPNFIVHDALREKRISVQGTSDRKTLWLPNKSKCTSLDPEKDFVCEFLFTSEESDASHISATKTNFQVICSCTAIFVRSPPVSAAVLQQSAITNLPFLSHRLFQCSLKRIALLLSYWCNSCIFILLSKVWLHLFDKLFSQYGRAAEKGRSAARRCWHGWMLDLIHIHL